MTSPTAEQVQQQLQQINVVLQDPSVPKFYMNGMTVGRSVSDMFVVMMHMGAPMGVLAMSFITAKTLINNLQKSLNEFEEKTGQVFLTMDEIQKKLQDGEG